MSKIEEAIMRMREALMLLDEADVAGDQAAHVSAIACSLQQAIDQAERVAPISAGEEIDSELLAAFEERCTRKTDRRT